MRCNGCTLARLAGIVMFVCAGRPVATAEERPYEGHQVLRLTLDDMASARTALSIVEDLWSENVGTVMDVRVSPAQRAALDKRDFRYTVLIEDVQALIDRERADLSRRGLTYFEAYHRYTPIVDRLNALAAARPDLATVVNFGTSFQGRPVWGLRISSPGGGTRPGVLYHGCQHAREWITPPVIMWIAEKLIEDYDVDPLVTELVNRAEWYLIPVVNPDGYEYTWTNNRMWRKNRNGSGVDLNRNWGYQWGGEGSSGSPSSDIYRGPSPFSEPETRVLRDWMLANPNIRCHIDYHSYSQLVLWPWGYTSVPPPDQDIFYLVGSRMQDDIHGVHGMFYVGGPAYTTIYPASGVSIDWAYGDRGILSYTIEVRDQGQYGFLLPAEQIVPTCEENFPAAMTLAEYATALVRFEFPDGLPEFVSPVVPTTLSVRIDPAFSTRSTGTERAFVRISSDQPFVEAPLQHLGSDLFEVTLPGTICPRVVEYYFSVETDLGQTVYSPTLAPIEVHRAAVSNASLLMADDFEVDNGWTVENVLPLDGAWHRAEPLQFVASGFGNVTQPGEDNPFGTGTFCYVTKNGVPGMLPGGHDVDNGPTRLISPVLDLDERDAVVSFHAWVYSQPADDYLEVDLSTDGGATWTPVMALSHRPAWKPYTFRMSDYAAPSAQTRIRFSIADPGNNSLTEALVDDVVVTRSDCYELPGDYNLDGFVDEDDILRFVEVLLGLNTDPVDVARSDFNADMVVDGRDVDAFVALQP
jgi:murein tripeptide amidase MpaA